MKHYKLKIELKKHPDGSLTTLSVWDERTQEYWESYRISERGVWCFLDRDDCVQSLNWNLNGNTKKSKYRERGDICYVLIYPNGIDTYKVKKYIFEKVCHNNVATVVDTLSKIIKEDPVTLLKAIAECFPEVTEKDLYRFLD